MSRIASVPRIVGHRSSSILRACLIFSFLTWIAVTESFAARVLFGESDFLHELGEVKLKSSAGEELSLGFKSHMLVVGLGIYCKSDGYVLLKRGSLSEYYPFPAASDVVQLQRAGLLPDPLPAFSLPWQEYLLGYSLWWAAIGAAIVMSLWDAAASRRRRHRSRLDCEIA